MSVFFRLKPHLLLLGGIFLGFLSCEPSRFKQQTTQAEQLQLMKTKLGVSSVYSATWLDSMGRAMENFSTDSVSPSALSEAFRDLGWRYCDIKAFGPATLRFLEANDLAKTAGDPLHETEATLALGWMFHRFQDYNSALTYYAKALQLSYKTNNPNYTARAYHELAKTSIYANELGKALKYAQYGLQLKNVTDPNWKVQLQNDIGLVHLRNKQYNQAKVAFETAIDFAGDNPYMSGYVQGNIGAIFLEQGKFTEAIPFLEKDMNTSLQLADYPSASAAAIDLSSAYLKLSQRQKALAYLQIADSLFVLDPEKNIFTNNFENWNNLLNELAQDKEKAELLGLLVNTLKNRLSIEIEDNNRQLLTVLQIIGYSNELKKSELVAVHANRIKVGYIYTALLLLLLLSGASMYFIYRSRMLKQKYRIDELKLARRDQELKILEQQKDLQAYELKLQKELAENQALRMEQLHQYHTHTQLSKGYVEDLTQQLAEAIRGALQNENQLNLPVRAKLESSLRMYEQSSPTQTDMQISSDEETNSFVHRLKAQFPDLSPDDVKLCTYLRLNMSTKEIATVKMITIAGVNKSRNRIRKKLQIAPSVGLHEFLLKL